MTFSIVIIDRENKEVGFAIAPYTWNAGMACTAEVELGAICSEAQQMDAGKKNIGRKIKRMLQEGHHN